MAARAVLLVISRQLLYVRLKRSLVGELHIDDSAAGRLGEEVFHGAMVATCEGDGAPTCEGMRSI